MRITICLFARLRDIAGLPTLELVLPDGATADAAWNRLAKDYPALGPHRQGLAVAVNEEFARFTTPLCDGDVVALLPPVSGG